MKKSKPSEGPEDCTPVAAVRPGGSAESDPSPTVDALLAVRRCNGSIARLPSHSATSHQLPSPFRRLDPAQACRSCDRLALKGSLQGFVRAGIIPLYHPSGAK
jgi:hypothetical protein